MTYIDIVISIDVDIGICIDRDIDLIGIGPVIDINIGIDSCSFACFDKRGAYFVKST